MEIKNNLNPLEQYRAKMDQTEGARTQRLPNTSKGETAAPAAQGDRISLSPEAKLRTEAYSAAMAAPEIRQAKVDGIKERVNSGQYQVDSKKVAAKLLTEEPGLFKA